MFDAKNLLEMLVRGAGQGQGGGAAAGAPAGGGLGDILGQLGQAMGQQGGGKAGAGGLGGLGDILGQLGQSTGQGGAARSGAGGGLGDILGQLGKSLGQPASSGRDMASNAAPDANAGGLGDILGKLQEQLGGASKGGQHGGGLMDVLGQILGQATQGVKEGAQRVDEATGASGHARDVIGKTTGQSPDDLFNQLKDLIQKNQLGAGAAAGGLGAVVLGTKTGRALATNALKLGGLALIGGLAYKALQNYQQGKPLIDAPQQLALQEAPRGSGYEAAAVTNDSAMLYIRGMIAAAAADGRIDAQEQQKIMGGLKQAGLDAQAEEFLANELNNPASIDDLVAQAASEEEAVQLFTAARIAIDLDTQEEHDFLVGLAEGLKLDGALVSHIDAAARATAAG